MPIFAIDKAVTEICRERRGGRICETRTLAIDGGGGRNQARLMFGDHLRGSMVGYLTRAGAAGVTLVGWLPAAAFDGFRAALASGGRLQMHYETRDGGLGYLRRIGVGRDGEPMVAVAAFARPEAPARPEPVHAEYAPV
jgi:hypothetical protein